MRMLRIAIATVAVCGLAAVPATEAAAAASSNSCAPGQEIVIRPGAFTATSNGSGSGGAGVFNSNTGPQSFDRNAQFSWSTRGTVTGNNGAALSSAPGSIDGGLTMQIIYRGRQVSFQSVCTLDVGVDNGQAFPGIQSTSSVFSGIVTGFPGRPAQNQSQALGFINVTRLSNGSLQASPAIEVGTGPCDILEVDEGAVRSGSLNAPSQSSERGVDIGLC